MSDDSEAIAGSIKELRELAELEHVLDLLGQADDAARCPHCGTSRVKAREGQERARVQSRMAALRAKMSYASGDTVLGIQLDELSNKFLTNERQFEKAWANDEVIAIREALDKADELTDAFKVLRGRPKQKGRNLSLAPEPD